MTRPQSEWDQIDAWAEEHRRDKTPPWFTPHRGAKTQTHNARRGLHPLGLPLAGNGETCGSCTHLVGKTSPARRRFLKCGLTKITHGPGTDIRQKWAACVKWKARP